MMGAANFDDSMVFERLVKVNEPLEHSSGRPDGGYAKYRLYSIFKKISPILSI